MMADAKHVSVIANRKHDDLSMSVSASRDGIFLRVPGEIDPEV